MKLQFACPKLAASALGSSWAEKAPDHVNPAAPEDAGGRLRQFVVRIGVTSKKRVGYRASAMARLTARSSGPRRRGSEKRCLFVLRRPLRAYQLTKCLAGTAGGQVAK